MSKTLNCIIVDDEPSSQQVIEYFISKTEILELQKTCNNASEAFNYLKTNTEIDLIFLDINMPNQSGLDFYKSLANPPKVIFTTAYSQFAVDGFEVNATDYLLKPIAYERFLVAINKLLAVDDLKEISFIILKENKTLHKVFFKDIIFAEAFGDYVKVHTNDKIVITYSTFSKFIKQLPNYFLRTHKSFSINTNLIQQLSGNQILVEKHNIPIGQTYKDKVFKALNQ